MSAALEGEWRRVALRLARRGVPPGTIDDWRQRRGLLLPAEAARLARCHVDTLKRWRLSGMGPPVWFRANGSGRIRYPVGYLLDWLDEQEQEQGHCW
jgi:hypothetical protein